MIYVNNLRKWLSVSLLISAISIVLVMFYTVDPKTPELIHDIRPEFLLTAAFLHLSSFMFWGLRTKTMCNSLGFRVGLSRSIEIVTSSTFLASVTPSSIGGEPLRIHLLNQDSVPVGNATAVVLGERLLDGILIMMAAPVALHLFRRVISTSGLDMVIMAGEIALILVFIMVIYAVWHPHHTRKALNFMLHRIAGFLGKGNDPRLERIMGKMDMVIEDFHYSMAFFVTKGRRGLLFGSIYTILFWLVEFAMVPVILMGLNQPPSIIISFAAQVLLMILLVIPVTPGSSGVAELGATSLFSVFVPAYMVGIVVVAWRVFTLYMNLIVGGFVSFKILKDADYIRNLMK
ncbi:lysylphosphatidylglycerol synthase transmembrane domain-containing protein [Methanococcoides orientis]|uniref:lysylphosphatidylglycerol synthase transmembrane domain-containing protein n=1 Tax=Methanococcoides orientis TaxID=2822137 RepID=UPI001E55DD78|nr:flippase-like domain-containing protein [Methanococcoides orientis]